MAKRSSARRVNSPVPSLQLRRGPSERVGGRSWLRGGRAGSFEDREVGHGEGQRGLMHELERDLLGVDQGAISPLAWIFIGTWD